jgi:branched-chain amino acid transport system permease protein
MTLTLQYAVDALNVGGLYAMMALGIGLIFGIMRLINFAHGELVMVGGYAMLLLVQLPGPLVLALSLIVVIVLALGMERLAFRPLREAAPSTLLVASFALSYFLQNFFVLVFGARPVPFAFASELSTNFEIGHIRMLKRASRPYSQSITSPSATGRSPRCVACRSMSMRANWSAWSARTAPVNPP